MLESLKGCEHLEELLLEATQVSSCMGKVSELCFPQLVKLRLTSCGLAGTLDLSQLPRLKYAPRHRREHGGELFLKRTAMCWIQDRCQKGDIE